VVGVAIILLFIGGLLGESFGFFRFFLGIIVGLYWLWGPAVLASLRNIECRKYAYAGFWRGEVLDVYISDEVVSKEENVNKRGELVVVEDRERFLNLEVGDETGFSTQLQVPLQRNHQGILPGDTAEMLVLSNRRDLGRIAQTSDIYIPANNIWVSDYPYVQRDSFVEISRQIRPEEEPRRRRRRSDSDEPRPRSSGSDRRDEIVSRKRSPRRPRWED